MSFRVEESMAAKRDQRRIRDDRQRLRIESDIQSLAQDPYPHGTKKLKGYRRRWRIRVRRYRIVYDIYPSQRLVEIISVDLRSESTYRRR